MSDQNTPVVAAPVAPKQSWMIPGSIIIAGAFISGAVLLGLRGTPAPTPVVKAPTVAPVAPSVDIAKVNTAGSPFIGKADAPVTVAIWADYQCPFCKRFDQTAVKQLIKEYADTGKVKIVFKDFSFLGPDSDSASLAGRAVWEVAPDKYADWHEAMFDKQDEEHGGWGSEEDILALVKSLGIDSVKVAALIKTKADEYQKLLDADKAEADTFGINGTPGTIIGTQLLSGAVPYNNVKQLVEKALAGK